MSDEPDNRLLVYLRRIDTKVDGLREDMREVGQRIGLLEGQYASLSPRVDRIEDRLERIERRLDIAETASA
jgi:predicted nuclease with TOPRIM domain